ncbi:hypothetical protein ASPZODRAFT_73425 [Penicilliopsis zonata CBS 506.65]|uniref:CWF21 domain-containing protein n=1 Tax=Penicilliopsis zonata CBS 506.65 TaxID=1073090 RepID=A0A1L9S9G6_9EURO|nr:hypothetical protein ASPZODRAFT_73425 [Penicilliopsis zonata CBS 506.65]OJJ43806.1 hypothetical protein ASPZODRAFT_73425 [Penicilliopsis zonata CBS 506.65]
MSSNVGLSTPRGSGTSGYVQRNYAFMKPRAAGYGAPYPPTGTGANGSEIERPFKQRQPDKQILEHDRRRAIEVKVLEERERLEERNEELEAEELAKKKTKGENEEGEESDSKILSEEEIEERCEALRARLRKQFKAYQVHELAEAKIEESERLRRALGIRDDWESGAPGRSSGGRGDREAAPYERRRD